VESFYREVHETGQNVMAVRTLNLAVGDFGVITEAVWNHMTPGATLVGEIPDADPHAHYLIAHHIMQNFAYTSDAKLIGERVYDDPASYSYAKLAPADVVTPEIARAQLAPFLARATLDELSRGVACSTGACRADRITTSRRLPHAPLAAASPVRR